MFLWKTCSYKPMDLHKNKSGKFVPKSMQITKVAAMEMRQTWYVEVETWKQRVERLKSCVCVCKSDKSQCSSTLPWFNSMHGMQLNFLLPFELDTIDELHSWIKIGRALLWLFRIALEHIFLLHLRLA
ncbi:hypothetical protein VNO77_20388 [Canavalia gladiata]|uniref:Uncharacterized protein n=1 Tax=Canavalia gladiata TaxID=3824 RepID=A0AAN9QLD9_CANGL